MLSKFSVKKPITIFVMVVAIIALGVVAFLRMTPELYPSINMPYVMVMTSCPGATPEEVEEQVTAPLEEQMSTLEDIKNVQSISAENYSLIILEFNNSANLSVVSVDIRDKIDMVQGTFDDTVQDPTIFKMNPDMIPTTIAAVSMEGKDATELSTVVEEDLKRDLEGINGVASVTSTGVVDSNIHISLDPDKIQKLNDEIQDKISSQTDAAKSQISSGVSAAQSGSAQVQAGKTQIRTAQQTLAVKKETIGKSLEQIETLVQARETARAAGNMTAVQSAQAMINAIKSGLKSEKSELSTIGIDLDNVDKNAQTAATATSTFNIAMSVSADELNNQMAELTGTDAYLQSSIMQLQTTLSSIDSAASGTTIDLKTTLTAENISHIIAAQNFEMPAGYVSDDGNEVIVTVGEKLDSVSDIENLSLIDLGIDGMEPIKISDVATVSYLNDSEDIYAKINGEDGILLSFNKQSDVPTAEVSENIQDKMDQLEKEYDGLKFSTLSDQGDYINLVINSVLENLIIGGILAILILLIFLRDIKPTLITAVSIPVSLIFAVVLMYFTGVSLNMISLAGLAVGVGMLVDNSIVVIENIYRLRSLGYSKVQAAVSGAAQVAGPITASTLTTICVFLPIIFVDGITKDIFTDIALTIGYSLIASLLIALTVVPAMGSAMLERISQKAWLKAESKPVLSYKRFLTFALNHRAISIIIAVFLLVGSTVMMVSKGFEFMPAMASQEVTATITMPEGVTKEEAIEISDEVAQRTQKMEGVKTVGIMPASDTGSAMGIDMGGDTDWSVMQMYVLMDEDKISEAVPVSKELTKMGKELDCDIVASGDTDMMSSMGMSGISIQIYGDDIDELRTSSKAIENELKDIDGITEISNVDEDSSEELVIRIDKDKAIKKGLTVAQAYQAISTAISDENTATSIKYDGGDRDIVVSTDRGETDQIDKKELTTMDISYSNQTTGESGSFTISEIGSVEEGTTLNQVERTNQKRSLSVTASAKDGYNITKLQDQVDSKIQDMDLPSGIEVDYDGENEQIMDSMYDLVKMMLLGLLLIYLIMVAQFQSLKSPFIVMFTVPLAFTGGLLALLITGFTISVVAMIGFVLLMGIIVNNGIMLIDYTNRLRREGMERREAAITAGGVRMRPVLMTAATTILGLLPLALGLKDGGEMMQPIAIVCIGGLAYATITTLIIIPIIYDLVSKKNPRKIEEEELTVLNV